MMSIVPFCLFLQKMIFNIWQIALKQSVVLGKG